MGCATSGQPGPVNYITDFFIYQFIAFYQYQKELMGYKSNAQKKRDIENFNRNYGVQTYSI